jgi:hypothetical protein
MGMAGVNPCAVRWRDMTEGVRKVSRHNPLLCFGHRGRGAPAVTGQLAMRCHQGTTKPGDASAPVRL